jgi:ABC-type multidrug transport system fused ATPase/permease subunit
MGQRRRIALARAIIQNRPIFILDEPTASLDSKTEELINSTIQNLVADGTCVIAIAHRPHLVINSDQVIEVKEPEFSGVSS